MKNLLQLVIIGLAVVLTTGCTKKKQHDDIIVKTVEEGYSVVG